jgi:hypothetical protein
VERTDTTGLRDPAARAANGSTGVVEITSGLQAGDTIVGVNLGALRAGSRVRVGATGAERDAAAGGAGKDATPAGATAGTAAAAGAPRR